MDARGNVTSRKGANGKITSVDYHPLTGLVTKLNTQQGQLQYTEYKYDGVGNLRKRDNTASGTLQEFIYDSAHRLTTITGYQPKALTYDTNGNILTQSTLEGGATYQYNNTSTGVLEIIGQALFC